MAKRSSGAIKDQKAWHGVSDIYDDEKVSNGHRSFLVIKKAGCSAGQAQMKRSPPLMQIGVVTGKKVLGTDANCYWKGRRSHTYRCDLTVNKKIKNIVYLTFDDGPNQLQ